MLMLVFLGMATVLSAQNLDVLGSDFEQFEMSGVDGEMYKCADFKDKKGIVLIFIGLDCIYQEGYTDRIAKLQSTYEGKGFTFLLIDSNDPEISHEDSFENLMVFARKEAITYPLISDPDAEFASLLNASRNPEAFVLLWQGESFGLFYRGAIDDNPLAESFVKKNHLMDALDLILAGDTADPQPTIPAKGCFIKSMDR